MCVWEGNGPTISSIHLGPPLVFVHHHGAEGNGGRETAIVQTQPNGSECSGIRFETIKIQAKYRRSSKVPLLSLAARAAEDDDVTRRAHVANSGS